MRDADAITALIHEYAFRLDAGDLDGVAALFDHAELRSTRHDNVRRGRAEARALYDSIRLDADGRPGTMHQLTNVTVQIDGDEASARTYFTMLQVTSQGLHPNSRASTAIVSRKSTTRGDSPSACSIHGCSATCRDT